MDVNNNGRSWADEIERRKSDLFEVHVRDGMEPLRFQRAELLDLIEMEFLPQDLIEVVREKFMGKPPTREDAEEESREHAMEWIETFKRMAVHLSVFPKLTLEDEEEGCISWRWLSQAERMKIIDGMGRMLSEGIDRYKPFRPQPIDGTDTPDGINVPSNAVGNTDAAAPGVAVERGDIPETREQ